MSPRSPGFTLLLGTLAALPPLSIDLGLPALPAIGRSFGVSPNAAGQTLSLFMLGFALAQLGFGPASDRFGRRPVLIAGCTLFSISGAVCALAGSLPTLLVARLLQGAGAGAGTVLAFAIVRDVFDGEAARRKLSLISVILSVAPIVAPTAGAQLAAHGGWRLVYSALAGAGALLTLAVAAGFQETRPASAQPGVGYAALARDLELVAPALVNALSFGCMFAYVAGSPGLFLGDYGLTATAYGLAFACTAGGIMAGAAGNGRLVGWVRAEIPMLAGLHVAAGTALALWALFRGQHPPILPLALSMLVLNTLCLGLISPNATHLALAGRPDRAGAASAMIGCAQMAAGAAAAALVAILQPRFDNAAMAGVISLFAAASLVVWLTFRVRETSARRLPAE